MTAAAGRACACGNIRLRYFTLTEPNTRAHEHTRFERRRLIDPRAMSGGVYGG
ncbi:hypothetical protein M9458_054707, partial [Cirrhinus mrigala]